MHLSGPIALPTVKSYFISLGIVVYSVVVLFDLIVKPFHLLICFAEHSKFNLPPIFARKKTRFSNNHLIPMTFRTAVFLVGEPEQLGLE